MDESVKNIYIHKLGKDLVGWPEADYYECFRDAVKDLGIKDKADKSLLYKVDMYLRYRLG